ncbi:MAG: four helix bundle protein [Dehalococcoidales bacterium]|jgi:four helix bundle protein|nr:four helix bundle protein [Dehalococcoidales bacterium]
MELEEIIPYQKALELYRKVVKLCIPSTWVHYSQIMRAAASIVANIAEGYGRYQARCTDKSQRNFLVIANGSLWEFISWLDIALIDDIISDSKLRELKDMSEYLSNLIVEDVAGSWSKGVLL